MTPPVAALLVDHTRSISQQGSAHPQKFSVLEILFAVIAGCSFAVCWLFLSAAHSSSASPPDLGFFTMQIWQFSGSLFRASGNSARPVRRRHPTSAAHLLRSFLRMRKSLMPSKDYLMLRAPAEPAPGLNWGRVSKHAPPLCS